MVMCISLLPADWKTLKNVHRGRRKGRKSMEGGCRAEEGQWGKSGK
jgi:hypothetical protein